MTVCVWVYMKVELTTDGGLSGHFWLAKSHCFLSSPTVGIELDYRGQTGETVKLERILVDPHTGEMKAVQETWLSIGFGDLAIWEHAGWQKLDMAETDRE